MDKETFDKAVDFAEETIREQFDTWRGDLGIKRARAYEGVSRLKYQDGQWQELPDRFLHELIRESEHSVASWDAVYMLAIAALEHRGVLTRELRSWTKDVLRDQLLEPAEKSRRRPITPDPDGDNLHARNVAIGEAMRRLVKPPWKLNPGRNKSKGHTCSADGGSACDAAGMAWNRSSSKNSDQLAALTFWTVASIWNRYKKGTGKNLDYLDTVFPEGESVRDVAGTARNPLSDEYRDEMEQQEGEAFTRAWNRYMKSKGENLDSLDSSENS